MGAIATDIALLNRTLPLAQHCQNIQGIYCLTFQVRSPSSAANYLRGKGYALVGDPATRFAMNPEQAFGRLIYFTDERMEGHPPLRSTLGAMR